MDPDIFDFGVAIDHLRKGKKCARRQFGDTCYIQIVYPNNTDDPYEQSDNTIPYLQMVKKITVHPQEVIENGVEEPRILEAVHAWERFPTDLSCESILGCDWYIVEEVNT